MLASAGCGPARFLRQVNDKAAGAVAAAKDAHADRLAPYEYTAATEYLVKAREEGAYAQYQVAIEYGRRAEELAVQARVKSQSAGATAGEAGASETAGSRGALPDQVPEPPQPIKDSP